MSETLFYKKPAVVNEKSHGKLKLKGSNNYSFAKDANAVLIAASEFADASKEYPIVFSLTPNKQVAPVTLLGVNAQQNLFIDEQGQWLGRYIPAFIRRYPFVLAKAQDADKLMVCIDEDYEGLNEDEGEPLFEAGAAAPFLQKATEFLASYQQQYQITEALGATLREWEMLKAIDAKMDKNGEQHTLQGLLVVDEEKLKALPDHRIVELFRKGFLPLIYFHLASLANLNKLLEKL